MRIVIDAGHGGKDSGAVNGATFEKDINLAIAKKLKAFLQYNGYTVIMTREDDRFITLNNRCRIANDNKSNLFISIHTNAASAKSAHGIETILYSLKGANKKLGDAIQSNLIKETAATNRGVLENSNLRVLNGTTMVAALVEVGFISNDAEMKKLLTDDYQNKLAKAIAKGVCSFYGMEYVEKTNSTTLYKVQAGSFSSFANAKELNKKLKAAGFASCIVSENYYKVQAGAFTNKENAQQMANKLKAAGFDAAIIH